MCQLNCFKSERKPITLKLHTVQGFLTLTSIELKRPMNSTKCPWGSCIYWGQLTHKVWMKFIQQFLLECVYKLPYFDTFWPEMYDDLHTTRYNTRVLELTNMDLHVFNIREGDPNFYLGVIVFIRLEDF